MIGQSSLGALWGAIDVMILFEFQPHFLLVLTIFGEFTVVFQPLQLRERYTRSFDNVSVRKC